MNITSSATNSWSSCSRIHVALPVKCYYSIPFFSCKHSLSQSLCQYKFLLSHWKETHYCHHHHHYLDGHLNEICIEPKLVVKHYYFALETVMVFAGRQYLVCPLTIFAKYNLWYLKFFDLIWIRELLLEGNLTGNLSAANILRLTKLSEDSKTVHVAQRHFLPLKAIPLVQYTLHGNIIGVN